jgi:hypothetical protein
VPGILSCHAETTPAAVAQVRTLPAASEIQRPRVLGGGVEVDRRVVPAQVTAERYHQNIALALAERVADLQKVAAHSESTAAPPRPHRRRLPALALGLAAIATLLPAGALAPPIHDAAMPAKEHAKAAHRHQSPSATRPSITFTNPLGRSRGPGAGAGLL